jgi:hypothetical protein
MNKQRPVYRFSVGQSVYVRRWPLMDVGRIVDVYHDHFWPTYVVIDPCGFLWRISQVELSSKLLTSIK